MGCEHDNVIALNQYSLWVQFCADCHEWSIRRYFSMGGGWEDTRGTGLSHYHTALEDYARRFADEWENPALLHSLAGRADELGAAE